MKVQKKPIIVDARGPLAKEELVQTAQGRVIAHRGDYILRDPNSGDAWPIAAHIFKATYDVLEQDRTSL